MWAHSMWRGLGPSRRSGAEAACLGEWVSVATFVAPEPPFGAFLAPFCSRPD